MNEYQDQSFWYELRGHDGFRWEFVADFDSYEAAKQHDDENDYGYEQTRIIKVRGIL